MKYSPWISVLGLVALVAMGCARPAAPVPSAAPGQGSNAAAAPAPDFSGKTVRLIVGFGAGGGYDTYMRTIARHIGKYLPGNPTIVVENMPGGGSLVAANYLAKRADPDGLTVGDFNSSLIFQAALGANAAQFTGKEFGWIGAPSTGNPVCAFMGFTGARTWQDVVASSREFKMGSTGMGASLSDLPRLLERGTEADFQIVEGYDGTADIRRAMQAGEVDGACWGWESMSVTAEAMLQAEGDERLIPVLVLSQTTDPALANLPVVSSVIQDPDELAAVRAWAAPYDFQRPLALPPGTPAPILTVWREALQQTLKDPQFLAEAKRAELLVEPVSGEQVEQKVEEIWAISPKAKESLQFLVVGR